MTALEKWKNDFKEFISELSMPRDDYKGIMGYIDEVPNEALEQYTCEDCRNCKKWNECPCGKEGHENGTSIGYSIGESKNYEPCDDCISRQEALNVVHKYFEHYLQLNDDICLDGLRSLPPVTPKEKTGWIPVSERLPDDLEPVNITWINRNPESYYANIKDKPFTATGHYCNGRWWWYSVTCQDYLNEYGRCNVDAMDDNIEVIAWQPLKASN